MNDDEFFLIFIKADDPTMGDVGFKTKILF